MQAIRGAPAAAACSPEEASAARGRQCYFLRGAVALLWCSASDGEGVSRSSGEDAGVEFPAVAFEPLDHAVGGNLLEREGYSGAAAADQAADDLVGER